MYKLSSYSHHKWPHLFFTLIFLSTMSWHIPCYLQLLTSLWMSYLQLQLQLQLLLTGNGKRSHWTCLQFVKLLSASSYFYLSVIPYFLMSELSPFTGDDYNGVDWVMMITMVLIGLSFCSALRYSMWLVDNGQGNVAFKAVRAHLGRGDWKAAGNEWPVHLTSRAQRDGRGAGRPWRAGSGEITLTLPPNNWIL